MLTLRSTVSTTPCVSPVVRPRLRTAMPSAAAAVPAIAPISRIEHAQPLAVWLATAQSTCPPSEARWSAPTTSAGQVPPSTLLGCAIVSPTLQALFTHITWKFDSIISAPLALSLTNAPRVPTKR